jgi:hypothetical protein
MTTPNADDHTHAAGCAGCDWPGDGEAGICHGCGHWRVVVWDYSHGYYCTDCRLAIGRWRRAEAEMAGYR